VNTQARLTTLTRVGFATRGLLYLVIAFLVVRAGRAEDPSGALRYLGQGGGKVLLIIMTTGLLAYSLWRLSDAMERVGAAASGVVHLLLAWQAIRLLRGAASAGDGTREGARTALQLPAGGTLIVVAGLILISVGVIQLIKAIKGTFLRHLEPQVAQRVWAQWSGRAGYAARGLVFLISGYSLLKAGFHERADEAGGTAQALSWLSSPIDTVVAAGLFAFGLFSLIEARFRILHDVPVDKAARRAGISRA
jgi:hypothetical protein